MHHPALLPAAPLGVPDVIDADYVVLDARPARPHPVATLSPPVGLETLRPRHDRARPFSRRGGAGFWSLGIALALVSFWVAGGHALVRRHAAPAQALELRVIESGVKTIMGRRVLAVEAEVVNPAAAAVRPAPPVALTIVTGEGVPMRHVLSGTAGEIAPGARRRYTSRLPVPPGGVRSVDFRFAS